MRWLGLALLLAACGQDDFVAPNLGNLKKDPPYDFAASKYPRDLGVVLPPDDDGGANLDAGVNVDLAAAPDLRKVNEHPDDMMP